MDVSSTRKRGTATLETLICFLSQGEHQQTLLRALRELAPGVRVVFVAQGRNDGRLSDGSYNFV